MLASTFQTSKTIAQYLSLICALVFNSILIILVYAKSPKKMGSYKYLMIYFSIFAMFFSLMDIIVKPYGHTYGSCFLVIMVVEGMDINRHFAYIINCILNGCFAVTIYTIAIHFVFRFFALERQGKLKYFEGRYLIGWFSIPICAGINWTLLTYFFLAPTQKSTDYLRQSVLENFGLNIDETVYVVAHFWPIDENGVERLNKPLAIAFINMFSLIGGSFTLVLYFGTKSYYRITNLITEGQSAYTINLQKQLYKALVMQAIIPMILMFIPIGIFVMAPMFNINIEKFGKYATFAYAMYPAIDPIPIMFIIDDYRMAIIEFLGIDVFFPNKVGISTGEDGPTSSSMNVTVLC